MSEKGDGGAAFSRPASWVGEQLFGPQQGMSLRDWFAGIALRVMLTTPGAWGVHPVSLAKSVYGVADGMLEWRGKDE